MRLGTSCPTHGTWPEGGAFCPLCGIPTTPKSLDCPKCGHYISPLSAKYCRNCGTKLETEGGEKHGKV